MTQRPVTVNPQASKYDNLKYEGLKESSFPAYSAPAISHPPISFQHTQPSFQSTNNNYQDNVGLRYIEERLDQERRAREILENELRQGKNAISQLNARIEQMSQHGQVEHRIPQPQDNVEIKKDVERMSETYLSRVNQLSFEQVGLKSYVNQLYVRS